MRLPDDLRDAVEEALSQGQPRALKEASGALSSDYRSGQGSHRGFQTEAQFLAYLATRLPATFGACFAVFQAIRERIPTFACRSMLDLGAGPGTASWAATEAFEELVSLYLVEKEAVAVSVGKRLAQKALSSAWKTALWRHAGLESPFEIPKVDMAVLSYALGELPEKVAYKLFDRLWEEKIPMVCVIEPGTPKGFERIRAVRAYAIEKGAAIVAPCPHEMTCPMLPNDWCHFSARIERTRLHRQLKEGSLGHEDEKYSYVVYAIPRIELSPMEGRVLRHPLKGSGFVKFPICAKEGKIREMTVTRSNKTAYRKARDLEWGSAWQTPS